MIKIKNKISKGIYEIIKVDENFKEFGNIYKDDLPTFHIYKTEKNILEREKTTEPELEKLTARYEIRLTETEKKIVTALREKGLNVSEQIRSFIISLDEQITRELNQAKFDQMEEIQSEILKELERMETFKKELEFLRGETQEEAQNLANIRANLRKTIEFLEGRKKKVSEYLEKYSEVLSSSEHRNG